MIMGVLLCTALELSKMQDQKLFTLCWRSVLGGGSDIVIGLCAHTGGQLCDYGLILLRSPVSNQHARPEIGDAPLKLISRMGQRACRWRIYFQSLEITAVWIDVTMQPCDCWNDHTKIVDAPLTLTSVAY